MLGDTGNKRAVRILLECILVIICEQSASKHYQFYVAIETGTGIDSTDAPSSGPSSRGSFRQQLDHLLTQKERSELKRALQIYAEKRLVASSNRLREINEQDGFQIFANLLKKQTKHSWFLQTKIHSKRNDSGQQLMRTYREVS